MLKAGNSRQWSLWAPLTITKIAWIPLDPWLTSWYQVNPWWPSTSQAIRWSHSNDLWPQYFVARPCSSITRATNHCITVVPWASEPFSLIRNPAFHQWHDSLLEPPLLAGSPTCQKPTRRGASPSPRASHLSLSKANGQTGQLPRRQGSCQLT